jgi:hypothetical protein
LAGLLARPVFDAFPSEIGQWQKYFKNNNRTYSCGDSSGISLSKRAPDSLLIPVLDNQNRKTKIDTNIIYFLLTPTTT